MKIRNKIYVLSLGLMLVLFFGCQDEEFLTQQDSQQLSAETLFKVPNDGIMIVNGIYDTFHDWNFMIKGLWYQANFLSQDWKNWGSDTFFNTFEVPTNFGGLEILWDRSYAGIARANSAKIIIDKMKTDGILTEELANRLTGEILFLRGFFYYYMGSEFGGVPLELQLTTDNGRHPRNTQDEVFAQVAIDMAAAAELLPWKEDLGSTDIGRANKGAALAYLGSAQMWLKKYNEAVISFEQIKGHSPLEENFLDIHSFTNQNGKESLFEFQYIAGPVMTFSATNDTHWFGTFNMPAEVSGAGCTYADKTLYDSFEAGDSRKAATVIGPGDQHPDPTCQISKYYNVITNFGGMNTCGTVDKPWMGSDGLRSGYYLVKTWRDPNVSGFYPISASNQQTYIFNAQNLIMMRYGEVLLSKAEALFKSGHEATARDVINNEIRLRAGLAPAPASKDFMEVLTDEYRHELTGEFSVWFLLRRAGEQFKFITAKYGISVPPGKDLMPIPQAAIANNPTLIQNPGY